MHTV
jgi:hypothetical protein